MNGVRFPLDDNYNHFLCIYLPVLHMFLEQNGELNSNYPIYYNGRYHDILKKYSNNILPLDEASPELPLIQYFPESLNAEWNIKTRERLMDGFIKERPDGGIFIRRHDRVLSNQDEIISIIKDFGINIKEIKFENLTFDEQIKISNGSEFMIGVHGSGLTNLMFMNQDVKIIEIDPFDWGFNCYEHLASNLSMKNFKRICYPTTKNKNISEFYMDLQFFKENIEGLV
jgi:capsular polysaccharide biosynthesis protein